MFAKSYAPSRGRSRSAFILVLLAALPASAETSPVPLDAPSITDWITAALTLVLALVGSLQAWIYWAQAGLMRKALDVAKTNADAAGVSAEATKANTDAVLVRLRPRLRIVPSLEAKIEDWAKPGEPRDLHVSVDINYRNVGGTPAYIDADRVETSLIAASTKNEDLPEPPPASVTYHVTEFDPGEPACLSTNSLAITETNLIELQEFKTSVLVAGTVEYEDIQGVYYRTTCCWILRYEGDELGPGDTGTPKDPRWGITRGPAKYNHTVIVRE